MSLFSSFRKNQQNSEQPALNPIQQSPSNLDNSSMANLALNSISDGIMLVNQNGVVNMSNLAAARMTGAKDADSTVGLDVSLCVILENLDGQRLPDDQNPLIYAIKTNHGLKTRDYVLVPREGSKKISVELSVIPTGDTDSDRIISFRNINKEKEEEDAQSEFISTASHEMRTPVASIEGYLGLALNPQTATIDERARGYLEAAHNASQHLGRLFRDLLDVTKLDDRKIKPHLVPLELSSTIKQITDDFLPKFKEKGVNLIFGEDEANQGMKSIKQPVYTFVDEDFVHEILSNLIENALKYTPEGHSVWVSVQGKENRSVVLVRDSGIGISGADLQHIFQKFYRVDNSQTREIGGTGLGLYIVKQRTESMGGSVWAESVYGEGSTFYVSLPRISTDEYNKRRIALENELQAQKIEHEEQLKKVMAMAQQQIPKQNSNQAQQSVPVNTTSQSNAVPTSTQNPTSQSGQANQNIVQ